MSPASAHRRAGFLLYAAVQFVALVAVAMLLYAEPYHFSQNFLSELGMTRTWSGTPNHVSSVLFGIALASVGAAFIAFAGAWRAIAFDHGRARAAGIAAQIFGTASGAAFVAVAVTPVNLAMDAHNTLVLCAFGLLFGFAASLTILVARNGATRTRLAATGSYLLAVAVYFASVMYAVRHGMDREMLVLSQKAIAGASMLYIAYFTLETRRRLQGISTAPAVQGSERALPR
jgi:hypothetical protein